MERGGGGGGGEVSAFHYRLVKAAAFKGPWKIKSF